ncbi:GtrA family protein [Stenotrophomonas sp.]|uniref:GtrA family protein n=1 Tax=Stenotrophomonas sp. TaxID=69392 RepID=UPI00289D4646|nr:GtrA family protein [Stenotrophomonas sp.]
MIQALASRQFLLFLLVGGVAALVNFLSRIGYSHWLSFTPAIVLAYLTGMVTAFVLSRLFVFKQSTRPLHHSAFYFVLVNLLAVLQTWVVSTLLAFHLLPWLGVDVLRLEIAHAVGVAVPVFSSYFGHKYLSFR